MQFAVTVVAPQGYVHSQAFREVAEGLHHSLLALGHDSLLTTRLDYYERHSIVLGRTSSPCTGGNRQRSQSCTTSSRFMTSRPG
jgi:hypothetical protein